MSTEPNGHLAGYELIASETGKKDCRLFGVSVRPLWANTLVDIVCYFVVQIDKEKKQFKIRWGEDKQTQQPDEFGHCLWTSQSQVDSFLADDRAESPFWFCALENMDDFFSRAMKTRGCVEKITIRPKAPQANQDVYICVDTLPENGFVGSGSIAEKPDSCFLIIRYKVRREPSFCSRANNGTFERKVCLAHWADCDTSCPHFIFEIVFPSPLEHGLRWFKWPKWMEWLNQRSLPGEVRAFIRPDVYKAKKFEETRDQNRYVAYRKDVDAKDETTVVAAFSEHGPHIDGVWHLFMAVLYLVVAASYLYKLMKEDPLANQTVLWWFSLAAGLVFLILIAIVFASSFFTWCRERRSLSRAGVLKPTTR